MTGLIVYYLASASAMLFYGIGMNRVLSLNENYSSLWISFFKGLMTAASTAAVGYLVSSWLLVPYGLTELYPFFTVIIFIIFMMFVEIFIGVGLKAANGEFVIPFLSVLLGMNEGFSIGSAVVITCCCVTSFYIMQIIFYSVGERVKFYEAERSLNLFCVLLISLAAIILALCGWNSSWLNLAMGGLN